MGKGLQYFSSSVAYLPKRWPSFKRRGKNNIHPVQALGQQKRLMPNNGLDHPLKLPKLPAQVVPGKCQGEGCCRSLCGFHLSLLTDQKSWAILFRQIRCFLALHSNIHPLPGSPAWDEAMPQWGCLDYHPAQVILLNTLSRSWSRTAPVQFEYQKLLTLLCLRVTEACIYQNQVSIFKHEY